MTRKNIISTLDGFIISTEDGFNQSLTQDTPSLLEKKTKTNKQQQQNKQLFKTILSCEFLTCCNFIQNNFIQNTI